MKTLKLIMISAFVAFAVVSFANLDKADTNKPGKLYNISFEQAMKIPGLSNAMYEQLDYRFLKFEQKVYTVDVLYMNSTMRITGTQAQWVSFFQSVLTDPVLLDPIYED